MIPALMLASLSVFATPADTLTPHRRAHHALGYDEAGRRVLLTGGSTPIDGGQRFVFFDDLWAFDGSGWKQLGSSGKKSSGSRLAFDRVAKRMVSFGGYDGRSLGDLRALEGDTWRDIGQHTEMPAAEPGFVYDSRRNRFVAFGGSSGPGRVHGDTWELEGTTWKRISGTGPAARQAHVMIYDERRGRTVVFGGMGQGPMGQRPPMLGDTWELDGAVWTERREAGPGARSGAGAAYDSKRGLVIIFGGVGSEGFFGDTWSWDGSVWRKLADSGPEPRGMGYLAYDAQRDRVVLFGGRKGWPDGDLNDTWGVGRRPMETD
jgi:hypothetical protein